MGKYIGYILFGVILITLGIVNFKGNISTIHWYNRRNVSEADIPKYGKCVGIGTGICGASLLIAALLELLLKNINFDIVILIGFAVGLIFILFGQFKYNKGLF